MTALIRYDAARAALEACVAVDEVKEWADKAAAFEAYARQAKDKDMRKMAIDIRLRAKRRLGELMAAQKAAGGARVGRPRKNGLAANPITLGEVGIDKNLAHEARRAAALSPEAFEAAIETRKAAVDQPDFGRKAAEVEPFDAQAELIENAAEAMAIVAADDQLRAAMDEVAKAKREAKTISGLYGALKAEVSAHKRETAKWMAKARKSALCKACKINLERDDE